MRVKFLLFSVEKSKKISKRFLGIGERISRLFFGVKYDLKKAGLEIEAKEYCAAAFLSALIYGIIFFLLGSALLFLRNGSIEGIFPLNIGIGLVFFFIFFFLHMIYPGIMAKRIAAGIDQDLVFALKSMLIQVSSGVPLFDSMKNIGRGEYGFVSAEFRETVQEISSGVSETKALERMALRTKSEYLRKATWQLIGSIKAGSSLAGAINSVVETLMNYQLRAIKNYAAELNLWILVYLLLAAAIPTLGITFLIILSSMGGTNISELHIGAAIGGSFIIQIVLIGFVKNRIPKVFL
ncbi:MAG: type II secretion system F family protein [archaeon]|nr:type II secretion system F family protein [Candidatus Micrarchaeota archaeon]